MEPAVGFEPTTDGLQNRSSTAELSWPVIVIPVICHKTGKNQLPNEKIIRRF